MGDSAARIRKILAGMCVNTMVLSKPIFSATFGAANWEKAPSRPDQKKNDHTHQYSNQHTHGHAYQHTNAHGHSDPASYPGLTGRCFGLGV